MATSATANTPKLTKKPLATSEGEKRAAKGTLKASMDACTNMTMKTLPLVLLNTHVMTMANATANATAITTNLRMSMKPLPPAHSYPGEGHPQALRHLHRLG
ncbi:MAG: hypothetical protein LC751_08800 [Actinobacteria bacterium]|nr:hypothetical protein [Actinomycetota bacterium]MCA1737925.1 hypothetical protein [Actinomycetota bacterium]